MALNKETKPMQKKKKKKNRISKELSEPNNDGEVRLQL